MSVANTKDAFAIQEVPAAIRTDDDFKKMKVVPVQDYVHCIKTSDDFKRIKDWLEANPGQTIWADLPGGITAEIASVPECIGYSSPNIHEIILRTTENSVIHLQRNAVDIELSGAVRFTYNFYVDIKEYHFNSVAVFGNMCLKLANEEVNISSPVNTAEENSLIRISLPFCNNVRVSTPKFYFDYPKAREPIRQLFIKDSIVRYAKLSCDYLGGRFILFEENGRRRPGYREIPILSGKYTLDKNHWPYIPKTGWMLKTALSDVFASITWHLRAMFGNNP